MDSRLDWEPHIDLKVIKAKIYMMMMHKGLGASWGPTPAITQKILYRQHLLQRIHVYTHTHSDSILE
jgi:hypothetical protein